ncbi:MAG: hypothetical protein QOJ51_6804 [Acidobacteriaceae bacterium]|nr:hypothetical protein [Acidobacteriaceae bacterium]MEA2263979.1 hypothetical protein [Acidobacteriaceae bacterium]
MNVEITAQDFEVRVRAFARHEAQLHEPACGIVDQHQQRTGRTALLEPARRAAINLDQFAIRLALAAGG